MSVAIRGGDALPALMMVTPEQLSGLADRQAAGVPEVNGHAYGHCPECEGDGKD